MKNTLVCSYSIPSVKGQLTKKDLPTQSQYIHWEGAVVFTEDADLSKRHVHARHSLSHRVWDGCCLKAQISTIAVLIQVACTIGRTKTCSKPLELRCCLVHEM
jgi:hypothetical protein